MAKYRLMFILLRFEPLTACSCCERQNYINYHYHYKRTLFIHKVIEPSKMKIDFHKCNVTIKPYTERI